MKQLLLISLSIIMIFIFTTENISANQFHLYYEYRNNHSDCVDITHRATTTRLLAASVADNERRFRGVHFVNGNPGETITIRGFSSDWETEVWSRDFTFDSNGELGIDFYEEEGIGQPYAIRNSGSNSDAHLKWGFITGSNRASHNNAFNNLEGENYLCDLDEGYNPENGNGDNGNGNPSDCDCIADALTPILDNIDDNTSEALNQLSDMIDNQNQISDQLGSQISQLNDIIGNTDDIIDNTDNIHDELIDQRQNYLNPIRDTLSDIHDEMTTNIDQPSYVNPNMNPPDEIDLGLDEYEDNNNYFDTPEEIESPEPFPSAPEPEDWDGVQREESQERESAQERDQTIEQDEELNRDEFEQDQEYERNHELEPDEELLPDEELQPNHEYEQDDYLERDQYNIDEKLERDHFDIDDTLERDEFDQHDQLDRDSFYERDGIPSSSNFEYKSNTQLVRR